MLTMAILSCKDAGFRATTALRQRSLERRKHSIFVNYLAGIKCFSRSSKIKAADVGTQRKTIGKLPKLPVPALTDTMVKYLRTVKPLLTEVEFQKTVATVKAFNHDNGIGPKLQKLLEHHASTHENWLSDWWLGSAYLEYRDPVVVYSSPGLVFPLETFDSPEDQLRYAAKLIFAALSYKHLIDTQAVPQDRMGTNLLDMSQYNKLFGTNRTPGMEKDQLKYSPHNRNFVVAHKNYFFKVDGYTSTGEILDPAEILRQLKYIIETTGVKDQGIPVGILTSEHRDTWGKVQAALREDQLNASSLQVLEEGLFLVSIDQLDPSSKDNASTTAPSNHACVEDFQLSLKLTQASLRMIHGNKLNSGNRWFDKTLQFIVAPNGECGLTYEHSPAEGPPIVSLMDSIVGNKVKYDQFFDNFKPGTPTKVPEKLELNLDNFRSSIGEATSNLNKLIDRLEMSCFTFTRFGRNGIKGYKFSPDSFIQMAIQAAFHRIHGVPGAHYESASTRIFIGGRTETIRSCSVESLEFAQALNSAKVSATEKYERLKQAIASHKAYAEQAIRGNGVDRHLLGLKLVALQNNIPLPELFTDAGFKKSTHFRLSTSQVPSKYPGAFMCYGPLVQDGYGCCYSPTTNEITFGLSAFSDCSETSVSDFKVSLQEVLLDMEEISGKNMQPK